MSRSFITWLAALCLVILAFAGEGRASDPESPIVTADRLAPATPQYSLHEWGLMRLSAKGAEIATSSTPGVAPTIDPAIITVDKPLIYLHPGARFDPSTEVNITVGVAGGTMREVWPTPGHGAQPQHVETFTWSGVKIDAGRSCGAASAPSTTHPACQSLKDGGVCEAAENRLHPRVSGAATVCLWRPGDI